MLIIFVTSGGPYDYIFLLHYIDCRGLTGFCYFKIISNLGRVWPAQSSMWMTLSLGAMTSQGASFNPSAPFSEQPNWHPRSWEKVVRWMLITFWPLTMKAPWTTNKGMRSPHVPLLIPRTVPSPSTVSWVWHQGTKSQPSTCPPLNTSQSSPLAPLKCQLRVCENLCLTKSRKVSGQSLLMKFGRQFCRVAILCVL